MPAPAEARTPAMPEECGGARPCLARRAGCIPALWDGPLQPRGDSDYMNTVGAPYSGKPNVRCDEGALGTPTPIHDDGLSPCVGNARNRQPGLPIRTGETSALLYPFVPDRSCRLGPVRKRHWPESRLRASAASPLPPLRGVLLRLRGGESCRAATSGSPDRGRYRSQASAE